MSLTHIHAHMLSHMQARIVTSNNDNDTNVHTANDGNDNDNTYIFKI